MQKNRITQSIIVGFTTLIATAIWAGLKNFLFENGNWLWPIIGFFILLVFLSLNWLITKSKPILLITLFFVLITFLFAFGFRWEYLSFLFIAYFLFFLGSQRTIYEKESRIKIETIMILKRGLPFIITGLSLMIVVAYYFSPLVLSGQNEITIPRPLFNVIVNPILDQFEEKIPFDNNDLYQLLNQEVNRQSQAYVQYLTFGLAIGLFFALKIIGFPFMWLVIFFSLAIFKFLVAMGAIKIQEQAVLKEVIEV
ncbi:MAG: hypothetical protein V1901_02855 [Patescibacteria group bacterium]